MSNILVAFFSAYGTTADVAKKLAAAVSGELHEIIPRRSYSLADLDWTKKDSRCSREMSDPDFRPPIANRVDDMAQYDTVFIGFPIWMYRSPTIINTFLEQYDFTGKKIIPFATSRLTGIDLANGILRNACGDGKLIDGKRFSHHVSTDELKGWAEHVMGTLFDGSIETFAGEC